MSRLWSLSAWLSNRSTQSLRIRVAAAIAAVMLGVALLGARLLVLAPAGQDEFDPYFGNGGFARRRRLKMLVGRAAAARHPVSRHAAARIQAAHVRGLDCDTPV